jgi:hypothetical protein
MSTTIKTGFTSGNRSSLIESKLPPPLPSSPSGPFRPTSWDSSPSNYPVALPYPIMINASKLYMVTTTTSNALGNEKSPCKIIPLWTSSVDNPTMNEPRDDAQNVNCPHQRNRHNHSTKQSASTVRSPTIVTKTVNQHSMGDKKPWFPDPSNMQAEAKWNKRNSGKPWTRNVVE